MFNYSKSVTISQTELKALRGAIESAIRNKTSNGCNKETFQALKGLEARLNAAKN